MTTKSHPRCLKQFAGQYSVSLWDDGTIEYWSVYEQIWVQTDVVPPRRELAAMGQEQREAILDHVKRYSQASR